MKNLAGDLTADGHVVRELIAAGINIVPKDGLGGEVPTTLVGELAGWQFFRAWYYWIAIAIAPNRGLPIDDAERLYQEHGKEARAGGDCACRPPITWARYYRDTKQVVVDPNGSEHQSFQRFGLSTEDYIFLPSLDDSLECFVECYHIDTQEALSAFAALIKTKKTLDIPQI